MSTRSSTPMLLAVACVVVGILAAVGVFNSISGFPWIFALIALGFGGLALWRERAAGGVLVRAAILVVGAGVAVGGFLYQTRQIEEWRQERRVEVLAELRGAAVPALAGLEPLNTDQASWDEAAALSAPATIVNFWARWCSPCWKEMAELEELYRRVGDGDLRIVAVTRYDRPDDPEKRVSDLDKAKAFLANRDHTFPAAITDDDELYRAYRVPGPPVTVLVDADGKVVDYAISLADARALMDRALELARGPELG